MRHNDGRFVNGCQIGDLQSQQVALQAEGNILDIRRTFTEIVVVHGFEHRHHLVGNGIRRIFGIDLVIFNHSLDLRSEFGVFRHHQMCIKYSKFFVGQTLGSAFLDTLDVFDGFCQCIVEFLQFGCGFAFSFFNHNFRLFELVRLCNIHACACSDSFEHIFSSCSKKRIMYRFQSPKFYH